MIRVVKLGGRVQDDAALGPAVERAIRASALVIVHGGGDQVSALQRQLGREPRFVGGRRVTSSEDIDIVRMGLSGIANKRLVSTLAAALVRAVGISGEDGGLLSAVIAPGAPLGRVGERVQANVALLHDLLSHGWTPVVSPVGRDREGARGEALNVNGDDAATAIAVALRADELLFLADVSGVLVDGEPLASITPDDAHALIERGVAAGGMAAKLDAARVALAHGVARIRITDLRGLDEPTRGTSLLSATAVSPWRP